MNLQGNKAVVVALNASDFQSGQAQFAPAIQKATKYAATGVEAQHSPKPVPVKLLRALTSVQALGRRREKAFGQSGGVAAMRQTSLGHTSQAASGKVRPNLSFELTNHGKPWFAAQVTR